MTGGRWWIPLAIAALHLSPLFVSFPSTAVTPPTEATAMQVSLVTEQPDAPVPRKVSTPPPPPVPALARQTPTPPPATVSAPTPAAVAVAAPPPVAAPVEAPPEPVLPPKVDPAHGSQPSIVYPSMSRRLNETGTVVLSLHVRADGRIDEANVARSSGFARLDRAAVDAALRWQLSPARRGNEPVAMWYQWSVRFELD